MNQATSFVAQGWLLHPCEANLSSHRHADDFSDVWSLAIEGSGTGVWDRNIVTGEIRYSRGWHAILGYEDATLSNAIEDSYTRVHPDDLDYVKATIEAHFQQRTAIYEVEHRLRCKDGRYKWVLSRGKVVSRDEAGRPLRMVGTTTDISNIRDLTEKLKRERKRARETSLQLAGLAKELSQRTAGLAAAHRLARVGSWRWDPKSACLWLSPETWWILGRTPTAEPVTYAQIRAMYHPDDYARSIKRLDNALRRKTPITLEYRFIHADGSIRDALTHAEPIIDADGEIVQVRGTTQDISPYRRIEAALRESEDHYRHMVDLHPQIPWTAGPDGGILEVGPQWLAMTGMTREDAMPFGWTKAVHPDDLPSVLPVWRDCLESGRPLDVEYRLRLAAGGYGWVRARAAARRGNDGQIIRWYGTLEDVTDRHLAEAARRASEALAFRVLEATGDAVIVCDRTGIVTFANTKAAAMLGAGLGLVGKPAGTLFAEPHGQRLRHVIARAVTTGEGAHFELFWPPAELWLEANLYVGSDDVSLFLRDISEKRLARQKLRYAATHDFMTGAANRATLFSRLEARLMRQTPGDLTALLCLDLDYFKEVNDVHGHPVGDGLLKQVTGRLHACLRNQDLLARCGGDEFVVMQTGIANPTDAEVLAERIIAAMRAPFEVDGLSLAGSLSIGIAVSTLDEIDSDTLYGRADRALYEAKTKARGSYRMFRPEMQAAFDAVRSLRADIAAGLMREEFSLAFQPIIQLSNGRVAGVEALLHWQHPERGLIPPDEFIPLAEESGQIASLGAWVLNRACAAARDWPEDVKVSVNVSPRQFELGDVPGVVCEALSASGLPARRLKLEVTESVLLSQNASSVRVLQKLRDLGVTLVLDDFGTGYSSLSYLDTFKFDFLKVDKSFMARVREAGDRQPILEAIMGMARALNLPVTAEGIETGIQLDYVHGLGCDFAQGRLFSYPLAADALPSYLARMAGIADAATRMDRASW